MVLDLTVDRDASGLRVLGPASRPLGGAPVMRRRMKVAAPLPLMVLRLASWGTVQVTVALPALEQEVTAERSPAENTPSRFQSTQPAILVLLPEQVIS